MKHIQRKFLFMMLLLTFLAPAGFILAQGDPDLGETASSKEAEEIKQAVTQGNFLTQGGWMMIPLGICSMVGFAYIIERFVSIRPAVLYPDDFLSTLSSKIKNGSVAEGISYCESDPCALSRIFRIPLLHKGESPTVIHTAMEDELDRVHADINGRTKILGVISGVSPLLGLMGTVLGMINAFKVVAEEKALGKGHVLAGGISEALVTTATGLGIAIPCYLFYHYFRTKADGNFRAIETQVIDFIARNKYILQAKDVDEDAKTKIKS